MGSTLPTGNVIAINETSATFEGVNFRKSRSRAIGLHLLTQSAQPDGLCAVYICIGKTADEEHIKEWAYAYCLWKP